MTKQHKFSAQSMFEDIDRGPQYALTGMVKAHDTNKALVLFAEAGNCTHWTEVDEKLISSFDSHGFVACGDHNHPVVTLHLVQPANPEAKVFARAKPRMSDFERMTALGRLASDFGSATTCHYDETLGWVDGKNRPCIPPAR